MRVAVIGAGPSGLVTLKYLKTAHDFFPINPIEAKLFEAEAEIGGTFAYRTYEDAELVSSKQLTTFSDFRPRKDDPDFLSASRYLEYLRQYCDRFELWAHINFKSPVTSIFRREDGGHIVHYSSNGKESTWECDAIAVCSGLHVHPNIPKLPGVEHVPTVLHSAEFKSREQFGQDTTVMVLGTGETGVDIAHLAITEPKVKQVVLSHRDGFLGAPKRMPTPVILPILGRQPDPDYLNVPVDVSQATLFDSMYLHPLIRDRLFLWSYYDVVIKTALWLISGTYHGQDQWVGGISKERYHASKVFFNKASTKALPYIVEPYRPPNPGIIERIRRSVMQIPLPKIPDGRVIDLAPWPTHIDASGRIHFRDNGRVEYERMKSKVVKPDVLVFATGYTQTFPFLDQETDHPYPHASDANVRDIWKRGDDTIGFIGFVRPAFGAIPSLAELQAQLFIMNLVQPAAIAHPLLAKDEHHYRLRSLPNARITYGVDHETYAYQLALDMDAAPSFTEILKAGFAAGRPGRGTGIWYKLPIIWAAGAQFNAKFRLRGPWAWKGAVDVLTVELWPTISRRGGFLGNFTLAVVPIVSLGIISFWLWVLGLVLDATTFLLPKRKVRL